MKIGKRTKIEDRVDLKDELRENSLNKVTLEFFEDIDDWNRFPLMRSFIIGLTENINL